MRLNIKILMVFVTEANATLTATDGTNITVSYKMSDIERQICDLVAIMTEQHLNAMLNGLVAFEIDTYFTKIAVGEESFIRGTTMAVDGTGFYYDYGLDAYHIPEIIESGILDNYRSVITTFNMNDYESLLHVTAGSGGAKYASIHMESLFGGLVANDRPFEPLIDFGYSGFESWWESCMELYLHEFTHTVEIALWDESDYEHVLDYHGTLRHYRLIDSGIPELDIIRLFLLNRAEVDEGTAGIPLWFWRKYSN